MEKPQYFHGKTPVLPWENSSTTAVVLEFSYEGIISVLLLPANRKAESLPI